MTYLGRVEFVGATKKGEEATIYGVSVRSEPNKARIAVPFRTRVYIGSSLENKPPKMLTDAEREIIRQQHEQAHLIFYDGIIASNGLYDTFAVVGNGRHTRSVRQQLMKGADAEEAIRHVLNRWGPELDGPNRTPQTPRIVGVTDEYIEQCTLGIISAPGNPITFSEPICHGHFYGLSTYAGDPNDPRKMVINHSPKLLESDFDGETAQELAEQLYVRLGKDLVVCTAAAVFDGKRWEFGVKNLHS